MLQSLLNACRLPDLRKRLIFTAFIIAMYRLGSFIPVPGVDLQAIKDLVAGGGVFAFLDLFAGGALERVAVFALGAVFLMIFFSALQGVYVASLFQFATAGNSATGLDTTLLGQAFVPKKR